jgi:hypothetical protein
VYVGLRRVLSALGQEGVSFEVLREDHGVGIVFDCLLCAIQVDLHVPVTFFAEKDQSPGKGYPLAVFALEIDPLISQGCWSLVNYFVGI